MATTNYWLQPDRQLDIRGTILFSDNTTKSLTATDIIRYEINEQNALDGFVLGGVVSGAYTLVLDNADHTIDPAVFEGAKITVEIAVLGANDTWDWQPFGVWYAENCDVQEQATEATITGYDAIGMYFDRPVDMSIFSSITTEETITSYLYRDTSVTTYKHYAKISDIISTVCSECGCSYTNSSTTHVNTGRFYDTERTTIESIEEEAAVRDSFTYRDIIHCAALTLGCFAFIDRTGVLFFRRYRSYPPTYSLTPGLYVSYTRNSIGTFELHYAEYKTVDYGYVGQPFKNYSTDTENEWIEAETIYHYIRSSTAAPSTHMNTLQSMDSMPTIFGSPASLVNGSPLFTSESMDVVFQGDPSLYAGYKLTLTDMKGTAHTAFITSFSAVFDGGLSMTLGSTLPSKLDTQGKPFDGTTGAVNKYRKRNYRTDIEYVTSNWPL